MIKLHPLQARNYGLAIISAMFFFTVSCKVLKTPYDKPYTEYEKPARYNYIEYSIAKGDTVCYIEDVVRNRTYMLWILNKSSLSSLKSSDLPKGFGMAKVVHVMPAKFSLQYKRRVRLMNDQYNNVFMRIH